jgi:CheY-like chemotaxis protein/DNA-binding HxlR family transcriptional regulator
MLFQRPGMAQYKLKKMEPKNKILIVDDDADLRENLVEILKGEFYVTTTASTAKEAIEIMKQRQFDVVLLDFMMPELSGLDALYDLKRTNPKAKVIMITAYATIDNAVNAIKRGASEFITKPFKIEDLLMLIKQVIEEARFEDGIKKLKMEETLSSLSNAIRRKILRLLNSHDTMRLMEITREVEIDDHTKVLFHLKSLKESKLVSQNSEKSYHLTNEGRKILECLKLLNKYLTDATS